MFQTDEWSRRLSVQLRQEEGERVKLGDRNRGKKEKNMLNQELRVIR